MSVTIGSVQLFWTCLALSYSVFTLFFIKYYKLDAVNFENCSWCSFNCVPETFVFCNQPDFRQHNFVLNQNLLALIWQLSTIFCSLLMSPLPQKRTESELLAACGSSSLIFAAAVVKQPVVVVGSRSLELFFLRVLCCLCFCRCLPSLPLGRSPSTKVQRVLQLLLFQSGCL